MELDSTQGETEEVAVTLRNFFETVPPGNATRVSNCLWPQRSGHDGSNIVYKLNLPFLELYCEAPVCEGVRRFNTENAVWLKENEKRKDFFVTYWCRNCGETVKTYALWAELQEDKSSVKICKFGEDPPFGPPTPARVSRLLADEKEYFFKGRQAESQGMGIAAFAYYRRVVENKKNRILDEIRRVADKIGAGKELIDDLDAARKEKQFLKAVKAVRHGIPPSLLVDGKHNPLELLHAALSEGLHAKTDQECLASATHVRVVLVAFVERAAETLKDDAEVRAAVAKLAKPQKSKRSAGAGPARGGSGPRE